MRKILVIYFYIASVTSVFAQEQTSEALPLAYSIRALKIDGRERSVVLSLSIKNVTDQPLAIDKKTLRFKLIYQKEGKKVGNGIGPSEALVVSGHPFSDGYKGDLLLLPPKSIHRTSETIYFQDSSDSFFENGHRYTLSLVYGSFLSDRISNIPVWVGTVESNKLGFKLFNNSFEVRSEIFVAMMDAYSRATGWRIGSRSSFQAKQLFSFRAVH